MLNRLPEIIGRCFLIIVLFFFCFFHYVAANPTEKNILIILPYTQDYPVHKAYIAGVKSGFEQDSQYRFVYSYEFLDLAHYANDEDYLVDTARYFQAKYAKRQPDLIVVGGDLNQSLVKHGKNMFPNVPVIMPILSWNHISVPLNELPEDFTVVHMNDKDDYERNIQLILQNRPATSKIYIVVGDSAVDKNSVGELARVTDKYAEQVEFVFLNKLPYEQMLERIRNAKDDTAVLFVRWSADVEGKSFIPAQVLQTICQAARIPVYGTARHLLGSGIVGGYLFDFEILGRNIAEVGLRILNGEKPSSVSVSVSPSEYGFDWRQLEKWGIEKDKLPQGSKIEYKEYSVWELYKGYIIGGGVIFLLETALIFSLLINRNRRKSAESNLMQLNMSLETRVIERTQELQDANDQLQIAQAKLEALNQQLDLTSRMDSLTNIYNRRHMEERIQEAYEQYLRIGSEFALVMADIDFFKKFNDTYGHDAGDYLLKVVSEALKKSIRTYDTVARWGGEEFLILLPATNVENAVGLAEQIRTTVEESRYSYGNTVLSVTLTLGVSVIRRDDTIATVIKRADIALYEGKRAGRNYVMLFDDIAKTEIPSLY